jgi:hypothetical protein
MFNAVSPGEMGTLVIAGTISRPSKPIRITKHTCRKTKTLVAIYSSRSNPQRQSFLSHDAIVSSLKTTLGAASRYHSKRSYTSYTPTPSPTTFSTSYTHSAGESTMTIILGTDTFYRNASMIPHYPSATTYATWRRTTGLRVQHGR